ncbi:MAG TPA: ATP-binding cassette domain-containing protein, partial [Clostridiaceae bacterium]|nr:ATP-binding cassette domain-containing protein [Clostridiaceae bacterium]
LNYSLEVRDLNFAYDNRSILQKLSFSVEAGEKILLKGASGSGKTTLLNLLAGVYTDYSGSITYDGQELRDIALPSLNEGIAEIYQDVFLFEDSLQNNITLFSDYPQSEIDRAVRQAGLSELIEQLPQGLSTPLTENGKNLSGGERQRIAIARAIIKGTRVLLADEATSSLDEALGRQIEATLLDLDATVIAISHRRYEGVTDRYDKVLEIESGSLSAWETRDYFQEVV